ncbi:8680_t:CDS:2, partial [Entrophospora sp. SA101]
LELALKQCNGKDIVVQKRLLKMQKKFNLEIQNEWEIWLTERRAIQVNRSITKTNMNVHNDFNLHVEHKVIEITINNIDYNYENNGEKDNKKGFDGNPFMASPVAILSNTNVCALTNDNDEILEWLESNKEKLVSFVAAEENLDIYWNSPREYCIIVQSKIFKALYQLRVENLEAHSKSIEDKVKPIEARSKNMVKLMEVNSEIR